MDDTLYRCVKRSQPSCIGYDGKITSALFKDPDGVSVDMKGDRTEDKAISDMRAYFNKRLKGIASLLELHVHQAHAFLYPDPKAGNPYHAELYKNEQKEELTRVQRLQLADSCKLVFWDENNKWS